jgi:putative membrane protein
MAFFGHVWALLVLVAFWVGVIALIIWVVRRLGPKSDTSASALSILNDRFARGEIDQQEYERRKAALLRH